MAVLDCEDDAVLFADGDGFFEELFNLVGQCGSDDVEVFGFNAEKHVAHAAASPESLVASFFEDFDDLEGGGVQES